VNPSLPAIEPMPPVADLALPWDEPSRDPVADLARARAACGDTFVVDSGGSRYLFVFSPAGVRSFYALPESSASKGIADWQLLRRKLPDELFDGRRTFPHDLFGRDDVARYLDLLDAAIAVSFDELGDAGELEVFAFTRRLGHRLGLACWAGERPSSDARFDELMASLDALDASAAFVHPGDMREVAAQGKEREREALRTAERLVADSVAAHDRGDLPPNALFGEIVSRWGDVAEPERSRGIAGDVVLVHLGSMSNLFAALAWTIIHATEDAGVAGRLVGHEAGLSERCALESTRLAQRSIMLRAVTRPVVVDDGDRQYEVEAGATVATLLPLTNRSAMPGLDGYDPDRWQRRRLRDEADLPARELVTAFGHGSHTCPAQPFSLAAMSRSLTQLIDTFALQGPEVPPEPLAEQIGGVARGENPCLIRYRRRKLAPDPVVLATE
jgi:cytochrome P450